MCIFLVIDCLNKVKIPMASIGAQLWGHSCRNVNYLRNDLKLWIKYIYKYSRGNRPIEYCDFNNHYKVIVAYRNKMSDIP